MNRQTLSRFPARNTAETVTGTMQARDFVWLAILGLTARAPRDEGAILVELRALAEGLWSPGSDLILTCVEEMVRGNHLDIVSGAFSITPTGQAALTRLIALPGPRPAEPMGQLAIRLKMAFLDLIDEGGRRQLLDRIVASYEAELAEAPAFDRQCGSCGLFGRAWADHGRTRLMQELALLRSFRGETDCAGCLAGHPVTRH